MDRDEAIKTLRAIHDKYDNLAARAEEVDAPVLADDYRKDRDAIQCVLGFLGVDG